jgi:hypothetical protein
MTRLTIRQYRNQVLGWMAIYIALMLLVWPQVRHVDSVPLKVVLALLPVLPMIAVLWLIARRVMSSDELEQRLYMIALSVATGIVCALSMIGGFLAASHVIDLDGDVLIWVFPLLSICYGLTHRWISRRYGYSSCE